MRRWIVVALVSWSTAAVAAPPPRRAPSPAPAPRARPVADVGDSPWLGIGLAQGAGPHGGALVENIIDESTPAARAGLMTGDEVVAIDAQPLAGYRDLQVHVRSRKVGDRLELAVMRGKRLLKLSAVLAAMPEADEILTRRLLDKPAPRLAGTLVPGTGGKADLLEHLGGKVVLVEFMASWCGPCHTTYRELSALADKHAGDGLVVLGVSDESESTLSALAGREPISFPLVRDVAGAIHGAYGPPATPTLVVIDRRGVVRYTGIGAGQPVDLAVFAAERALAAE